MFTTCIRVGNKLRGELVRPKVKTVSDGNFLNLTPNKDSYFFEITLGWLIFWQNNAATMSGPFGKRERRRSYVHLPIPHKYVTVAPEPTKTLVLVDICVVGVQKTTMADNEVEYWIPVAVRFIGIASKHIVDLSTVVFARRYLTVAVIVSFSPWVGKRLEFIAF